MSILTKSANRQNSKNCLGIGCFRIEITPSVVRIRRRPSGKDGHGASLNDSRALQGFSGCRIAINDAQLTKGITLLGLGALRTNDDDWLIWESDTLSELVDHLFSAAVPIDKHQRRVR